MKKRISGILLALVFLVGLGVLLYPTISSFISAQRAARTVAVYRSTLNSAKKEDFSAWFEQADAYNEAVRTTPGILADPSRIEGYDEVLAVTKDGVMGYVSIEKIGVKLPVYHGVDEKTLLRGIGHMPGTSVPAGGPGTHCVLSGHTGEPGAKLFTDLDKLVVGDTFTVSVLDRELLYQVDQIKVVLPHETEDLRIDDEQDYCTLVTCTPYGINSHRLLVRGVRTEAPEIEPTVVPSEEAVRIEPFFAAPVAAAVALIFLFLFFARRKKPEKKQ